MSFVLGVALGLGLWFLISFWRWVMANAEVKNFANRGWPDDELWIEAKFPVINICSHGDRERISLTIDEARHFHRVLGDAIALHAAVETYLDKLRSTQ